MNLAQQILYESFAVVFGLLGLIVIRQTVRTIHAAGCRHTQMILCHAVIAGMCTFRVASAYYLLSATDSEVTSSTFYTIYSFLSGLPYIGLFIVYSCIVWAWSSIYHYAVDGSTGPDPFKRIKAAFLLGHFIVCAMIFVLFIMIGTTSDDAVRGQVASVVVCCVAVIVFGLGIGFTAYGTYLARPLTEGDLIDDFIAQHTLHIFKLSIGVTLCTMGESILVFLAASNTIGWSLVGGATFDAMNGCYFAFDACAVTVVVIMFTPSVNDAVKDGDAVRARMNALQTAAASSNANGNAQPAGGVTSTAGRPTGGAGGSQIGVASQDGMDENKTPDDGSDPNSPAAGGSRQSPRFGLSPDRGFDGSDDGNGNGARSGDYSANGSGSDGEGGGDGRTDRRAADRADRADRRDANHTGDGSVAGSRAAASGIHASNIHASVRASVGGGTTSALRISVTSPGGSMKRPRGSRPHGHHHRHRDKAGGADREKLKRTGSNTSSKPARSRPSGPTPLKTKARADRERDRSQERSTDMDIEMGSSGGGGSAGGGRSGGNNSPRSAATKWAMGIAAGGLKKSSSSGSIASPPLNPISPPAAAAAASKNAATSALLLRLASPQAAGSGPASPPPRSGHHSRSQSNDDDDPTTATRFNQSAIQVGQQSQQSQQQQSQPIIRGTFASSIKYSGGAVGASTGSDPSAAAAASASALATAQTMYGRSTNAGGANAMNNPNPNSGSLSSMHGHRRVYSGDLNQTSISNVSSIRGYHQQPPIMRNPLAAALTITDGGLAPETPPRNSTGNLNSSAFNNSANNNYTPSGVPALSPGEVRVGPGGARVVPPLPFQPESPPDSPHQLQQQQSASSHTSSSHQHLQQQQLSPTDKRISPLNHHTSTGTTRTTGTTGTTTGSARTATAPTSPTNADSSNAMAGGAGVLTSVASLPGGGVGSVVEPERVDFSPANGRDSGRQSGRSAGTFVPSSSGSDPYSHSSAALHSSSSTTTLGSAVSGTNSVTATPPSAVATVTSPTAAAAAAAAVARAAASAVGASSGTFGYRPPQHDESPRTPLSPPQAGGGAGGGAHASGQYDDGGDDDDRATNDADYNYPVGPLANYPKHGGHHSPKSYSSKNVVSAYAAHAFGMASGLPVSGGSGSFTVPHSGGSSGVSSPPTASGAADFMRSPPSPNSSIQPQQPHHHQPVGISPSPNSASGNAHHASHGSLQLYNTSNLTAAQRQQQHDAVKAFYDAPPTPPTHFHVPASPAGGSGAVSGGGGGGGGGGGSPSHSQTHTPQLQHPHLVHARNVTHTHGSTGSGSGDHATPPSVGSTIRTLPAASSTGSVHITYTNASPPQSMGGLPPRAPGAAAASVGGITSSPSFALNPHALAAAAAAASAATTAATAGGLPKTVKPAAVRQASFSSKNTAFLPPHPSHPLHHHPSAAAGGGASPAIPNASFAAGGMGRGNGRPGTASEVRSPTSAAYDESEPGSPTSIFDHPDVPERQPSPVPPLILNKAVGVMIKDQLDSP